MPVSVWRARLLCKLIVATSFIFAGAFSLALHAESNAANKTPPAKAAPAETVIELQPDVQEQLRQTADNIERQQWQLNQLKQKRNELTDGRVNPDLDKTIDAAQKQLDDQRQRFIELATSDYDLLHNDEPLQLDVNLQQEMLQVIYPLVREMKQLSERPRAIEKLSAQIAFYRQRNDALDKGLIHLREVIAQTSDHKLLPALRKLEDDASRAQTDIQQKLESLQRRQQDLLEDSPPLWSSLGGAMRDFATGMGWHLLLGLALAIATYLFVQLLTPIPLSILEKRRLESFTFIERSVRFFSRVIGALGAAIVLLMVLYSQGEWVLLGVAVIIYIGLFFGLKNVLPNYLTEIRTVLNLGSVRQGERLIYNGLPWRIADLDFYTLLHNPALSGVMRVPLTQISKLSSRPFHKDEPWFPTNIGDTVIMSDGIQGRVERQTTESVQINCGESLVTYRIEKFLDARPQNISTGFAVSTIFSIDYRHQHEALTVVERQFKETLAALLAQQDFSASCLHLDVEFKSAGTSSLDFRIVGLFRGDAAEQHGRIQRWMQRAALECANTHDWNIPYQQITVHTHPAATENPDTKNAADADKTIAAHPRDGSG